MQRLLPLVAFTIALSVCACKDGEIITPPEGRITFNPPTAALPNGNYKPNGLIRHSEPFRLTFEWPPFTAGSDSEIKWYALYVWPGDKRPGIESSRPVVPINIEIRPGSNPLTISATLEELGIVCDTHYVWQIQAGARSTSAVGDSTETQVGWSEVFSFWVLNTPPAPRSSYPISPQDAGHIGAVTQVTLAWEPFRDEDGDAITG